MSFLGIGGTPQPTTVALDPASQNIENQEATQAGQDSSVFGNEINQNVQAAASGLMNAPQEKNQAASLGGNMPGDTFGAIRNAYSNQAGAQISGLMNQNQMQAQLMKADYMNQVGKAMLGQQVNAANQYQTLTNAYVQQNAARAGAIASLFQTANSAMIASKLQVSGANGSNAVGGQDVQNGQLANDAWGDNFNLDPNSTGSYVGQGSLTSNVEPSYSGYLGANTDL